MGNVYTIRSTDGTTKIDIIPGQADGYNGYEQTTDLKLHGFGYLNWGAGVNEDLLRITENFSSPEKENGDYNSISGIYDFVPSVNNIVPKDWRDLGHGLGVNNPLVGQTWFNTTKKQLYVYTNTTGTQYKWLPVVDSDALSNKVNRTGDTMTGFLTLNSNPVDVMHAATKQYVDTVASDLGVNDKVNRVGDTMTGFLTLHSNPINDLHAATKQYVDVINQDTGVVAGTYNTVTVDTKGKVVSGSNAIANEFLPSGTKLLFPQAAAPTGWTQDTTDGADNRMLRVVNTTGGGFGGSHSPILNNVVPAHTHTFTTGTESANHIHYDAGHAHGYAFQGGWNVDMGGSYRANTLPGGGVNQATAIAYANIGGQSANHSHSGSTGNGSSQTNWTPRYKDIIICTKN